MVRIHLPPAESLRTLSPARDERADIVGLSGITFRGGGAAPPDLSGWRASEVDERIGLIPEAVGDERYGRLEISALIQRVVVTDDRHKAAEELTSRWTQDRCPCFA
jgi:hypothetical protein